MANKRKMDLETLAAVPPWEWPDEADDIIMAVLRDRSAFASRRLTAAQLAGDYVVINDKLCGELLRIAEDPEESAELRGKAAVAFGAALEAADMEGFEPDGADFDLPGIEIESMSPISEAVFHRIQQTLHRLYLDPEVPKLTRRRALEASIRAKEDWHADAIRAAYRSGDAEWRLTAVFAMRFICGFKTEVREALREADPLLLCEAIRAAGSWEIKDAWPRVEEILKRGAQDRELFFAAIGAAMSINPEEAESILWALTDSEDEEIAEAAEDALYESGVMADVPEEDLN